MILPEISFNLKAWTVDDFSAIRDAHDKIDTLQKNAGTSSDKFQQAVNRFARIMFDSGQEEMLDEVSSSLDSRAVIYLLLESDDFRDKVIIDRNFIDKLKGTRSVISRLALTQFIRFFFQYFNLGLNKSEFSLVSLFIMQQLEMLEVNVKVKVKEGGLGKLYKNRGIIFTKNGPSYIAKWAQDNKLDLDIATRKIGVSSFHGGQFDLICRGKYYLGTLKRISIGEEHPILNEILKSTVHSIEIEPGRLLGHEALSIIISRGDSREISETWLNFVLTIAGDPRVSENTKNYQRWWSFIDDDLIKKVRTWLAKFDLKLFLQILEDSAHAMGIEDMERMFTSRKVFMEGLLDQGLVSDSRLFLSRNAQKYIRQNYRDKELPSFVKVNEADTSMIYLKVATLHMLEGSHSFKVKVMKSVPLKSSLLNYNVKEVKTTEFRVDLMRMYVREFIDPKVRSEIEIKKYAQNNVSGYFEATHNVGLGWQKNIISFFRKNGVVIDPSTVLTTQQYVIYKRKFGLETSHA